VAKIKKNLKYEVHKSVTYVNPTGLVTHIDQNLLFTRGELYHEARKVEFINKNKKPIVLPNYNFEFSVGGYFRNLSSSLGHWITIQTVKAESPPSLLLW
jgi:hypothetical protein